jgi:hypothetical protein
MQQTHVFTSAALNYVPKVRILFKSLREHHPEWKLHLALADELRSNIDLAQEPFDTIIPISDLGIASWRGWAFCHDIVELATAIKPFTLARLLKLSDTSRVIYLDPDIVVFSRLDDIVDALEGANIVLTPHQVTPEKTLAAVIDNEICSLKHGIYNLGFCAVAPTEVGHEFASWWKDRIYHFCRRDIPNGLFTDQRWIDLVPAFFQGVAIMRSERHNVATWNLTTREVSRDAVGRYMVNGEPLGFYHFTGFDSGNHHIMAAKNGGENASIDSLISWYTGEIKKLALDPLANERWAFGFFSNGKPIVKAQRAVYRERSDLQRAFPDPFNASGYLSWWNARGKIEYPELFDEEKQGAALQKFSHTLTPGYRTGSESWDWAKVGGLVKQSLTQPQLGINLGRRGWELFKREGFTGVKRRFLN